MKSLRESLEEYLSFRRKCGVKLRLAGQLLHKFVLFAEQERATFITKDLALRWSMLPKNCQPSQWANRLSMVRRFAQFCSATEPRTHIPSPELCPHRFRRKPPYIYREEEIIELLQAAKQLWSPNGLRAATYYTLFGLLAITGMRMSEPIALDRHDVDLIQGILTVRKSKFGKSRLIPVHLSTRNVLQQYAQLRDQICPYPKDPNFFISERGTRLTDHSVRWNFVKVSRQIGLRSPTDSYGPRLHDLRHGFAITTMLSWYRAGIDIEKRIHELSAYLGHGHVNDTYWYISAVPELLRLASFRLEHTKGEGQS